MENIDREDWLRISKSGCSIKLGWQEKRIVASVPHGVAANCNEQWLEDAQRLCDGWNELPILKAELESLRQQLAKPVVEPVGYEIIFQHVIDMDYEDATQVILKVGNQQFNINDWYEDKEQAEWMASCLRQALSRIALITDKQAAGE